MHAREHLMREISELDFAALDINLFLDSHPNNTAAAMKASEYRKRSNELRKEYEDKYGPINSEGTETNRWSWISGKWPWDIQREVN